MVSLTLSLECSANLTVDNTGESASPSECDAQLQITFTVEYVVFTETLLRSLSSPPTHSFSVTSQSPPINRSRDA